MQCMHLQLSKSESTAATCAQKCCDVPKCTLWQYRPPHVPRHAEDEGGGCWINEVSRSLRCYGHRYDGQRTLACVESVKKRACASV